MGLKLSLAPAKNGGYVVLGYNVGNERNDAILFAGCLEECLDYIRAEMDADEARRKAEKALRR